MKVLPDAPYLGHDMAHAVCSKGNTMQTVVPARVDQATIDGASAILDAIGLTVSDAFRVMMRRIVAERRLAFDPLESNAATIAAIKAARRPGRSAPSPSRGSASAAKPGWTASACMTCTTPGPRSRPCTASTEPPAPWSGRSPSPATDRGRAGALRLTNRSTGGDRASPHQLSRPSPATSCRDHTSKTVFGRRRTWRAARYSWAATTVSFGTLAAGHPLGMGTPPTCRRCLRSFSLLASWPRLRCERAARAGASRGLHPLPVCSLLPADSLLLFPRTVNSPHCPKKAAKSSTSSLSPTVGTSGAR